MMDWTTESVTDLVRGHIRYQRDLGRIVGDASPPPQYVARYVDFLELSLVKPHLELFRQGEASQQRYNAYWIVAKLDNYLIWFDPEAGNYGLGGRADNGETQWAYPNARGPLVDVFVRIFRRTYHCSSDDARSGLV